MWPFFCDLSHAYFHSLPFLIRLYDGIFHVIFFMSKNLGTRTPVQSLQCLSSRRVPSASSLCWCLSLYHRHTVLTNYFKFILHFKILIRFHVASQLFFFLGYSWMFVLKMIFKLASLGLRWFEWEWPPEAHTFERMVPSFWNCLGRMWRCEYV